MQRSKAERDRASIVAFGAFWVIIIIACFLGYGVVHALGLSGSNVTPAVRAVSIPPAPHPKRPAAAPFTVASIFAAKPRSLAHYRRSQLRTLIATGDVIPARSVNYKMIDYHDFLYPWRHTASYLRTGDLTLINLESPLLDSCPLTDSGMSFCGDSRAIHGLSYAGVDVACTANNHIGNYGSPGIQETWQHLRAAGIQVCGYDQIGYKTVRGVRFAFVAFNGVGERLDYAFARREIRLARSQADIVVASVHWGKEYVTVPTIAPGIADDDPVRFGHWLIDSGADLVIGNHPHHVQGVELYHGHLITYAHGNFIFDQMFTVADCPGDANLFCTTREGVVGAYTFAGRRLVAVRYRPVVIYDYSQPSWATPPQAQAIMTGMQRATAELARQGR